MRRRGSRGERAAVRQQQLLAKIEQHQERTTWYKYARCFLCHRRFVVNNYPDQKARVSHLKYKGKIVCVWCRARPYKKLVRALMLAGELAEWDLDDGSLVADEFDDERMFIARKKARKIASS